LFQHRAIISSVFYLTSSLPSLITNSPQHPFYGLSPTGLGRGGSDLDDYEGHNFWDTEMFMMPPAALIKPKWAKQLLHYRFMMLNAAKDYAEANGYQGVR
jgi:protein-glucosylgalactosylhydroxylysine glucosidase